MKKNLGYIKGLFLSPNKTFKKIVTDNDISLVEIIVLVIIANFFSTFWILPPSMMFSIGSLFVFLSFPVHLFITAFIFHVIAKLFKKRGSLLKLFIALSFVTFITAMLSQIGPLFYISLRTPIGYPLYVVFGDNIFIPMKIASVVFILFSLYLKALAISNAYSFSKTKSFFIVIFVLIALASLGLLQVSDSARNLKTFLSILISSSGFNALLSGLL